MPEFLVKGADAKTGRDVSIVVEANTPDVAERVAAARGVLVELVAPNRTGRTYSQAMPKSPSRPAEKPKQAAEPSWVPPGMRRADFKLRGYEDAFSRIKQGRSLEAYSADVVIMAAAASEIIRDWMTTLYYILHMPCDVWPVISYAGAASADGRSWKLGQFSHDGEKMWVELFPEGMLMTGCRSSNAILRVYAHEMRHAFQAARRLPPDEMDADEFADKFIERYGRAPTQGVYSGLIVGEPDRCACGQIVASSGSELPACSRCIGNFDVYAIASDRPSVFRVRTAGESNASDFIRTKYKSRVLHVHPVHPREPQ